MLFYDRTPRLLFPFGLIQLFCRKTSLKSESTTFCRLLSMWVKTPFLPISSSDRHTNIGQAPSIGTWNLALSGRWLLPLSSEPRQPIHRLRGTEASPGAIRAWRYMRVSWMLQARCRSQAWRTVQISAYYSRFVYVKVRKIRETTKASGLFLPPHPFFSLDVERHNFRES